jgi:hypothetical protein
MDGERMEQVNMGKRPACAIKELELIGPKENLPASSSGRTRARFDLRDIEQDATFRLRKLGGIETIGRQVHLQLSITTDELLSSIAEEQPGRLHRDRPGMPGRSTVRREFARRSILREIGLLRLACGQRQPGWWGNTRIGIFESQSKGRRGCHHRPEGNDLCKKNEK